MMLLTHHSFRIAIVTVSLLERSLSAATIDNPFLVGRGLRSLKNAIPAISFTCVGTCQRPGSDNGPKIVLENVGFDGKPHDQNPQESNPLIQDSDSNQTGQVEPEVKPELDPVPDSEPEPVSDPNDPVNPPVNNQPAATEEGQVTDQSDSEAKPATEDNENHEKVEETPGPCKVEEPLESFEQGTGHNTKNSREERRKRKETRKHEKEANNDSEEEVLALVTLLEDHQFFYSAEVSATLSGVVFDDEGGEEVGEWDGARQAIMKGDLSSAGCIIHTVLIFSPESSLVTTGACNQLRAAIVGGTGQYKCANGEVLYETRKDDGVINNVFHISRTC